MHDQPLALGVQLRQQHYVEVQMSFCAEVMLEVVQNVVFVWIREGNASLLTSNLVLLSGLYLVYLHSANLYSNGAEALNGSGRPLTLQPRRHKTGHASGFSAFRAAALLMGHFPPIPVVRWIQRAMFPCQIRPY